MRLLSANHFFLPLLLAWTCLCVTASTSKEKAKIIPASTLKDVANRYPDIADQAQQFQEQLNKIVEHAKNFKRELVKNNIEPMTVHDYMTWEAANIVEIFREELEKPVPDGKDERARSRNPGIIDDLLDTLENAFVYIGVKSDLMSEQVARRIFAPFKYVIRTVLFIVASPFSAREPVPVPRAALDVAGAKLSRSLSFEVILSSAKEKGEVIAASVLKDAVNQYAGITDQVNKIVEYAKDLKRELVENNIDPAVVHDYLTQEAFSIAETLRTESPSPDELEEKAHYRNQMISKALDHLEDAFVFICVQSAHLSEQDARRIFAPVKKAIQDGLFIIGDFVDKHPELAEVVIVTAVSFLIPESFILRPILSIFGFGPVGPVKGSWAAWMQSKFRGGAVAKGSWFAFFQRTAMKAVGKV
ncbi:hypothetical protein H1R20_g6232, partial [Candolleomyces eurysporus]